MYVGMYATVSIEGNVSSATLVSDGLHLLNIVGANVGFCKQLLRKALEVSFTSPHVAGNRTQGATLPKKQKEKQVVAKENKKIQDKIFSQFKYVYRS